jgi:hypothetical protein
LREKICVKNGPQVRFEAANQSNKTIKHNDEKIWGGTESSLASCRSALQAVEEHINEKLWVMVWKK